MQLVIFYTASIVCSLFSVFYFYIVDIRIKTQKNFKINFGDLKTIIYICSAQGAQKPHCWPKGEKGIRCESGTIPVAVYLDSIVGVMFVAFFATGKYWEGATNEMSQKTYLCI